MLFVSVCSELREGESEGESKLPEISAVGGGGEGLIEESDKIVFDILGAGKDSSSTCGCSMAEITFNSLSWVLLAGKGVSFEGGLGRAFVGGTGEGSAEGTGKGSSGGATEDFAGGSFWTAKIGLGDIWGDGSADICSETSATCWASIASLSSVASSSSESFFESRLESTDPYFGPIPQSIIPLFVTCLWKK